MTLESMDLKIDKACEKMGIVCITGDLNANLVVDGHINVTGTINGDVIATGNIRCSQVNGSITINVPHNDLAVEPDIVVRNGNLMFEGSVSNIDGHLYSNGPVFNDTEVVAKLNCDLDITSEEKTALSNMGMYFAVGKGCRLNAISKCEQHYGIANYNGCFVVEENAIVDAIGSYAGIDNGSGGIVVTSGIINAFGDDQAIRNCSDFIIRPNGKVFANGCLFGFYNFDGAWLFVNGGIDSLVASGADSGIYNIGGDVSIVTTSSVVAVGGFHNRFVSPLNNNSEDLPYGSGLEVNGILKAYNTYSVAFINEYPTIWGTGCIYSNGEIYYKKAKDSNKKVGVKKIKYRKSINNTPSNNIKYKAGSDSLGNGGLFYFLDNSDTVKPVEEKKEESNDRAAEIYQKLSEVKW